VRSTIRILWATAFVAAVLAPAGGAGAKPVRTNIVTAFKSRVACGVNLVAAGSGISCYSEALPSTELDGYVELHAHGKSKLGERGDSPWRNTQSLAKLKRGQRWQRVGVKCRLRKNLRCENADGHGFTLSPKAYALF
jgi:hypothetical protein